MPVPDAVTLAGFLGCLFFLVAGSNQIMRLLDRTKEQPPPASTYVTKDIFSKVHEDYSFRISRIEAEVADIRSEMKSERESNLKRTLDEVGKVHNRINDILAAVSELRGEVRRKS